MTCGSGRSDPRIDAATIFGEINHHASQFEFISGQAPVPCTFAEMMPTLINPILGGGTNSQEGLTLMAIGETLRSSGVDALVYPSARSDAFVVCDDGRCKSFGGWCMVNLTHHDGSDRKQYVVTDPSPWGWTRLPYGVQLHEPSDDPAHLGTLLVDGVVEAARRNYSHQVGSLQVCKDMFGPLFAAMCPYEAYHMARYIFRWVNQALADVPRERYERAFKGGCGLILRNGRQKFADEMKWIDDRVLDDGDAKAALERLAVVRAEIEATIPEDSEVRTIFGAAAELELALLVLT